MIRYIIIFIVVVFLLPAEREQALSHNDDPLPTGLGWNPSGTQLAVGYSDGHVEILDSYTNELIYNLPFDSSDIYDLVWSPDGTMLATGGYNPVVNVWNVANEYLMSSYDTSDGLELQSINSIGWSLDNNSIIIAQLNGNPNLHVIDVASGLTIYSERAGTINEITHTPDGQLILALHVGEIQIRDEDSFEVISIFEPAPNIEEIIAEVAWSADGQFLVIGALDTDVLLWDDTTGQLKFQVSGGSISENLRSRQIREVWFNEESTTFSSVTGDGRLRTWSTATGALLADSQLENAAFVTRVVISPDLTQLAYINSSNNIEINQLPMLLAGADQTLTADAQGNALVTLDGSDSTDPDGTIVSYVWTENGVEIATGATPQVTLSVGTHTIVLTVTDDDGAVSTDEVLVTVEEAAN